MPLDQAAAKTELRKFMDPKFFDYQGDAVSKQDSIEKAINAWKRALQKSCESISPSSTTLSSATEAFVTAAEGMHLDPSGAIFQAACASFATQLGNGMVGYTAIPPLAPFIPIGGDTSNAELSCDFKATQLVQWLKNGKATNIASGVVVSWS